MHVKTYKHYDHDYMTPGQCAVCDDKEYSKCEETEVYGEVQEGVKIECRNIYLVRAFSVLGIFIPDSYLSEVGTRQNFNVIKN